MAHPERLELAALPTPLLPLARLGATLGFAPEMLWVKRDDLTALAGGGNKARKLEYLVADAVANGADTLVTAGAAQSNHVRTTAAAACQAGLRCVAVLGGRVGDTPEGNLLLDELLGLEPVWVAGYDAHSVERMLADTTHRLLTEGARPYEIPLGGASAVGSRGYVHAARELMSEMPSDAVVYAATGTGGTQAGLAVGFGSNDRVRGVDVGAIPDVRQRIDKLIPAIAQLEGLSLPGGEVHLDATQIGEAYGTFTEPGREALRLAAATEGLILDPVYSGKAMAGLIADRRADRLPANMPVVFLHTGGFPSVFTQRVASWISAG